MAITESQTTTTAISTSMLVRWVEETEQQSREAHSDWLRGLYDGQAAAFRTVLRMAGVEVPR